MNLVHRRSKKSPSRIAGFFCKFGELPAPPDHFVCKREWGMHKVPTGVLIDDNPRRLSDLTTASVVARLRIDNVQNNVSRRWNKGGTGH